MLYLRGKNLGSYYEVVQELQALNSKVDVINSTLGGISANYNVVSDKLVLIACCSICILVCFGVSVFVKKGWFR